jgi:hypothetical protein
VYFVINGLTNEKSGIYKLDCSNQDTATPVCLSVGKARHLTLVGDTLYFADGNNSNKLSKISAKGGENQTRTLVVDEKIHNLVHYDGVLLYTVNGILDDYIEKYTISNNARKKLTSDAGQSLTVVGDKLYYVNVDLFSTNFIGQGIYRGEETVAGQLTTTHFVTCFRGEVWRAMIKDFFASVSEILSKIQTRNGKRTAKAYRLRGFGERNDLCACFFTISATFHGETALAKFVCHAC